MTTPRKAGEKTRQKLRNAGVDPSISEKPGLTMDEAYSALYAKRDKDAEEAIAEFWRSLPDPPEGFLVVKSDEFDQTEVVGEDYYADDLEAVYKRRLFDGEAASGWASLVRNPDNPYDEFAVEVRIDGKQVGHISGFESEYFSDLLAEIEKAHGKRVCCPCLIDDNLDVWLIAGSDELEALIDEAGPSLPAPPLPNHDKYAHLFAEDGQKKRKRSKGDSAPPAVAIRKSVWDLRSSRFNQCCGCLLGCIVLFIVFILVFAAQY